MRAAVLCLLLYLSALIPLSLGNDERGEAFAAAAQSRIEEKPSVRGDAADWFFLVKELRHVAAGKFWEKPWEDVAKNGSDPVPSIIEFHKMLQEQGVGLVVVPVPPKAVIYPEKLDSGFQPGDAVSSFPFLEQLLEAGVNVVDLEREFIAAREEEDLVPWYCQGDAHYSPFAIERIADLIVRSSGIEPVESTAIVHGPEEEISIVGDQIVGSEWEGKATPETISIRPVLQEGSRGVKPDPGSSVVVLGDSHTLVFHEGKETGMHCRGAGIVDQLSQRTGVPVDLVGVRGSGLVQARKKLFFHASEHPGYWTGKKLVVWVFSAREFTQSRDRIVSVPLEK